MVVLLEREHEQAQIGELLDRAAGGEGCALLIEGPAGIGKTELLRWTREAATDRRMRTLAARGGELERELPFVVVRELLARVVERARAGERDELMAGAAGLATAVLDTPAADEAAFAEKRARQGARPSSPALAESLHGLFWLCSNLAERGPLLLAVDDVQWADAASLRFFAYLARRIDNLPALLVMTIRTSEAAVDDEAIRALRAAAGECVLTPGTLSATAVRHVLERSYGDEAVAEEFARACHGATGGNPFLLRELLVAIREAGLRPRAVDAERVQAIRPHAAGVAVRGRLARLPGTAVELARAMSVLGVEAELRHAAGLAEIDEEEAELAADALAAAELIEPQRPLTFRHPLIRGAVYEDLAAGRRATAHARAARQLREENAPSDVIAAHLVHTSPTRDERVVEVLREASIVSTRRGAPQQAVRYLQRALTEPATGALRGRVLHELGTAELAAGNPDASQHLSEALDLAEDRDRAEIAEQLAVALDAEGRHGDVVAALREEISRARAADADGALRLEAAILSSAALSGHHLPGAADAIARLEAMRGDTPGERLMLAATAWYAGFSRASASQTIDLARRALAGNRLLDDQRVEAPPFWIASPMLMFAEYYDEHLAHVEAAEQLAARQGSVVGSALALSSRAMNAYLRGAIADAAEHAADAMQHAVAAEWAGGLPMVVGIRVLALIEQAELTVADRLLRERQLLAAELPRQQLFDIVLVARGSLRLAEGRPADALEDLRRAADRQARRDMEVPFAFWSWRPLAAGALAALSDRSGARSSAEDALRAARRWGAAGPIAAATRALAVSEEGEARIARLREAVAVLDGSQARLERMHALLELGAALRRERHVVESREPLATALELAEPAGAEAIAERARAELAAAGARRRKRTFLSGVEALTPAERRAAEMAAHGMSNPEIAQSLFVSRKTVENYLGKAYAKLGISGRTELVAKLGEE